MSWLWPVVGDRQEESYMEPTVEKGRLDRAYPDPALEEALYRKESGAVDAEEGSISCLVTLRV